MVQLSPGWSVLLAHVLAVIRYSSAAGPPNPIVKMLTATGVATFVKVTVCDELVLPRVTVPKFSEAGNIAISLPHPNKETVCGLSGASSMNERVPAQLIQTKKGGVKITLILHVLPTATGPKQVLLEMAKKPLTVMLEMFRVAVPVFRSVTFFGELLVPAVTTPNASFVVESVTAGDPLSTTTALAQVVPGPKQTASRRVAIATMTSSC